MSNVILHQDSANRVVTMVKNQIKYETGVYRKYADLNEVTVENISAHVAALTKNAYPGVVPGSRPENTQIEREAKAFKDKVRLGLRRALGDVKPKREVTGDLLTKVGKETLAEMGDDEILAAIRAELGATA